MPISDEIKTNNKIDYKQKYINLKRKLKLLIYENESYGEELRKSERQLLQVSRDKSYLLDRLLQYEKIESSTSDSEDTVSSDSEVESRKFDAKKKKLNETNESQSSSNASKKKKTTTSASATRSRSSSTGKLAKTQSMATQVSGCTTSSTSMTTSTMTMPLIKSELSLALSQTLASCSQSSKASVSSTSSINSTIDGHMTSEELERHLESRRQPSALLMPEKTPLTVPVELFSNESSNGLPEDDNHINLKLIS